MVDTAQELEKGLLEMLRGGLKDLPPSEQGKVSEDVTRLLRTVAPGKKIYVAAFNLRDEEGARQAETILNNEEMETLNTAIHWSPNGDLVYMMLVEVSAGHYAQLRPEPVKVEEEKPSLGARLLRGLGFRVVKV